MSPCAAASKFDTRCKWGGGAVSGGASTAVGQGAAQVWRSMVSNLAGDRHGWNKVATELARSMLARLSKGDMPLGKFEEASTGAIHVGDVPIGCANQATALPLREKDAKPRRTDRGTAPSACWTHRGGFSPMRQTPPRECDAPTPAPKRRADEDGRASTAPLQTSPPQRTQSRETRRCGRCAIELRSSARCLTMPDLLRARVSQMRQPIGSVAQTNTPESGQPCAMPDVTRSTAATPRMLSKRAVPSFTRRRLPIV